LKTGSCCFVRFQVEDFTVVRSREPGIEPAQEFGTRSQCRHPLVIDGCENGAADQNLAAGIAFAFRLADARDEPVLLHPQASEPLVECLKTDADFFGLRHCASFVGIPMQVRCRDSGRQERAVQIGETMRVRAACRTARAGRRRTLAFLAKRPAVRLRPA
jgi:hypothetical protein